MNDLCDDNRFELIEKHKKELIDATNIETAPDEMAVLDDILFRFWQMGWLDSVDRMPLVKESARTLMHSAGNSISAKAFRNAGRFVQNAIDGEPPEFEKLLSAQQEQRWMPCSERLPEKAGMYLITEQNYGFKVDAICKNVVVHPSYFSVDEKEFKDTVYIPDCSNITAWMPLPEPYMRGEQDAEIR